ncbi:unnamed protein product [Calicophoron daubneyi]|uniref:PDZ domain-containing protein n=1 Tax=Calicophoron daubneyi TaxID=300641 RepID=A0AAV2T0V4_CALDB
MHTPSVERNSPHLPVRPKLGMYILPYDPHEERKTSVRLRHSDNFSQRHLSLQTAPATVTSGSPIDQELLLNRLSLRRMDRIPDWPQFRLRRKINSTGDQTKIPLNTTTTTKMMTTITSELANARQPVRALHSFRSTTGRKIQSRIRTHPQSGEDLLVTHGYVDSSAELDSHREPFIHSSSTIPSIGFRTPHFRRGITTNPKVRRRYSAEGVPLHLDETTTAPSPAKRIYQDGDHNRMSSSECSNSSWMDNHSVNSQKSDTTRKWYFSSRHKFHRRSSKAEACLNGLAAEKSTDPTHWKDESDGVDDPRTTHPRRKSSFLSEIRRSARQTLESFRRVLRSSSVSVLETSETTSSNAASSDSNKCDQRNQKSATRRHTSELPPTRPFRRSRSMITGGTSTVDKHPKFPRPVCPDATRTVKLERDDLRAPFGLFVVRSKNGFRVTRVSSRILETASDRLEIGEEIVCIDGIPCSSMTLIELIQLFTARFKLILTVHSANPPDE